MISTRGTAKLVMFALDREMGGRVREALGDLLDVAIERLAISLDAIQDEARKRVVELEESGDTPECWFSRGSKAASRDEANGVEYDPSSSPHYPGYPHDAGESERSWWSRGYSYRRGIRLAIDNKMLRGRLAELEADLAHMRADAGPDSCADYAVDGPVVRSVSDPPPVTPEAVQRADAEGRALSEAFERRTRAMEILHEPAPPDYAGPTNEEIESALRRGKADADAYLASLAGRAIRALAARSGESVEAWAARLADDTACVDGEGAEFAPPAPTPRDCTCVGGCRGPEGLAPGWRCVLGRTAAPPAPAATCPHCPHPAHEGVCCEPVQGRFFGRLVESGCGCEGTAQPGGGR